MVSMKTLPLTEARKELPNIVDEVSSGHEHVVITKRGRPQAVVMSVDEFESWQETLEIMADKKAMAAIARAERDIKAGRIRGWEEIKAGKRRKSA
jgi:antitoxin YefM